MATKMRYVFIFNFGIAFETIYLSLDLDHANFLDQLQLVQIKSYNHL